MNRNTRILYWIYIAVALFSWSPSNALGYLAPLLFLLSASFLIPQWDFLVLFLMLFMAWVFQIIFYVIINPDFQIASSFVSFMMWSGLMILMIFPYNKSIQYTVIRKKLSTFAWSLLLIESILGIIQFVYGLIRIGSADLSTGDVVEGTFHPALDPELSFSNPMFSVGISLLLIFLWKDAARKRNLLAYVIYFIGAISLVLASTLHVMVTFAITLLISTMMILVKINFRRVTMQYHKSISVFVILIAVISFLLFFLQPSNTRNLLSSTRLLQDTTPRTAVIAVILQDLRGEYSFYPLFGLGPGQFASRAGLISTGLYFDGQWTKKPSEITSRAQRKYLIPLKIEQVENPAFGRSSTKAPHSSWIAVFSEWGYLGVIVVILSLLIILSKVNRVAHSSPTERFILTWGILFFFFLGWSEIYWEVPQAWFPGLILLKLIYFECKQSVLASKNELPQPATIHATCSTD